ncbi:MAG TPA: folylpolyglutamate synthase/dihydrofolate synthase family protein [Longimicrobiales bacterium]|nr:folylpolyglutamate synthase/dihydrofolate synthase family protein [Longimicrobiales bacterium]
MPDLTYRQLTDELFPRLTGGIRWGLDRTRRLLAGAGDPHRSFRVVHVGGTNGKGSVAAHVDAVLRSAGHRTALYSSPHLCTFRERIRVDGRAIGEDALLAAAERLWPAIRRESPSFFEATTCIAFLAMAEAGVEYGVVEVGLGGRLDSTNVVDPEVVVLTNVSLDHVQLLGSTLEDVAREKAGIIKPGAPVITGEAHTAAAGIFAAAAAAAGASLRPVRDSVEGIITSRGGTDFVVRRTPWGELPLHTPLPGAHQAVNAALAVHAVGALGRDVATADAVRTGIAATTWPGRLQVVDIAGVTWVFDVAHNVAGVEALAAALPALGLAERLTVVLGVLGDKDWAAMTGPVCALAGEVLLTVPPTAPPERRWDPAAVLAQVACPGARVATDFVAALEAAHARAQAVGGAVLVTGSFHTVGDALVALGLAPDGADFDVPPPAFLPASRRGR